MGFGNEIYSFPSQGVESGSGIYSMEAYLGGSDSHIKYVRLHPLYDHVRGEGWSCNTLGKRYQRFSIPRKQVVGFGNLAVI